MIFQIYTLVDPKVPDVIRYIGQTQKTLEHRLKNHLRLCVLKAHTHKNRWIFSLLKAGRMPVITCIETYETRESADGAERNWIAKGREQGWPLTNQTEGGFGGEPTEEVRQRLAELTRAYWKRTPIEPQVVQGNRSAALRKRYEDPSFRQQRAEELKKRWQDPAYRQKMSKHAKGNQANKGRKFENRKKASGFKRNAPTEETKEKMRQAMARFYNVEGNREAARQRTLLQHKRSVA